MRFPLSFPSAVSSSLTITRKAEELNKLFRDGISYISKAEKALATGIVNIMKIQTSGVTKVTLDFRQVWKTFIPNSTTM